MSESGGSELSDEWMEQPVPCPSLFDAEVFSSADEAIEHDAAKHDFHILQHAAKLELDFYAYIRLVNYIRSSRCAPQEAKKLDKTSKIFTDANLLKPVTEDESLLQVDYDGAMAKISKGKAKASEMQDRIDDLQDQLSALKKAFAHLQTRANRELWGDSSSEAGPSNLTLKRDDDIHYFRSYAAHDIHESMLKDTVRTRAYRDFIQNNPSLFKDKVVLDVGCGTGILSLFAARAGARRVYAVDASDIAFKAMEHVRENGLEDVVKVLHGKVEDSQIPEQVDIIVSEWMGYFLLYESMLDSVLSARDRFLAPGGLLVPSQCSMLLAGVDDEDLYKERIGFWDSVYGFKMSAMQQELYDDALIDTVAPGSIATDIVPLHSVHVFTAQVADLDFTADFVLKAHRHTRLKMLCVWFDTLFTQDGRQLPADFLFGHSGFGPTENAFTTGPHGSDTHWHQTVFLLKTPIDVKSDTKIAGTLSVTKAPNNIRELVVTVNLEAIGRQGQTWHVR